jgi:hypothetical protein
MATYLMHNSESHQKIARGQKKDTVCLGGAHPRMDEVRHPPRSGWLDELGRLKDGRSIREQETVLPGGVWRGPFLVALMHGVDAQVFQVSLAAAAGAARR